MESSSLDQDLVNNFGIVEGSTSCPDCELSWNNFTLFSFNVEKLQEGERALSCPNCLESSMFLSDIRDPEDSSLTCSKGSSSHSPDIPQPSRDQQITRELKIKLAKNHYTTAAGSMDACGNATVDIECNDCGHMQKVDHHCDNRVCGKCGSSRWSRTVKNLKKRIFDRMDWNNVRFMTLTVGNKENLDKQDVIDIRESFKKLKRRDYFDSLINGGVYAIECNYNGSWNLHMHVVYEGGFIDQKRLSDAWEDITGYGVVDVRKSNNKDSDAKELAKYISKQPDVSSPSSDDTVEEEADRLFEYHEAMYRTNLVQPFGIFHHSSNHAVSLRWANIRYECPECGSEDIKVSVPPTSTIGYSLRESDPPPIVNLFDWL